MKKYKYLLIAVIVVGFLVVSIRYLQTLNFEVLNPKGPIARQERNLIYVALALSLLVVIPVYTLTIVFAIRYREGNKKATYSPNLSGNKIAETIWWVVPTAIISVLGVIAWNSSHTLDPYRPISSNTPPLTIQVVALDWKWLFIYPKENIASVNYFDVPMGTPLNFEITSDSVMNSFWIPQLGGQIYAMPGMSTQLHLEATSYGSFRGLSANISGTGFAGMNFVAQASSSTDFNNWVSMVKSAPKQLSAAQYASLDQPSQNNPISYYSEAEDGLYDTIVDKYVGPGDMSGMGSSTQSYGVQSNQGMDMMQ